MADVIYQGGMKALVEGLLQDDCDLRIMLVAENFTGQTEEDAINIADFTTVDEFSGAGYIELDCQNVTMAYDSDADEYRLDFDAGEFNADGSTVAPGPRDAIGILVKLRVDGTEANDIAVAFSDSGGFPLNGVNTAITFTPPSGGLLALSAA